MRDFLKNILYTLFRSIEFLIELRLFSPVLVQKVLRARPKHFFYSTISASSILLAFEEDGCSASCGE